MRNRVSMIMGCRVFTTGVLYSCFRNTQDYECFLICQFHKEHKQSIRSFFCCVDLEEKTIHNSRPNKKTDLFLSGVSLSLRKNGLESGT